VHILLTYVLAKHRIDIDLAIFSQYRILVETTHVSGIFSGYIYRNGIYGYGYVHGYLRKIVDMYMDN